MVLILGANGVAGVSAAGVLLTATGTLGALAYAGWALADRLWTTRRTRLRALASATARQASALAPGSHGEEDRFPGTLEPDVEAIAIAVGLGDQRVAPARGHLAEDGI